MMPYLLRDAPDGNVRPPGRVLRRIVDGPCGRLQVNNLTVVRSTQRILQIGDVARSLAVDGND
jgi:hypothetical protein